MNILIFVMSMLMIFALMTYSKLDSYRNHASLEGEFTNYMETTERSYINNSADALYKSINFKRASKANPAKNSESAPTDTPKGKGSGRLSIRPLIYSKFQEENPALYEETVHTFKELVQTLYGHQTPFQEFLQKHHNLLNALIEKLPQAVAELPATVKINRAIDLSNLKLGDPLDELVYLMFKGCTTTAKKEKIIKETDSEDALEEGEDPEEESEESEETESYISDKSDDALLNFVDLHTSLKINVYLASKPLLLALYGNPNVVDRLLAVRYQLYKSTRQDKMTKEEASDKLYSEFQLAGSKDLLEYKVTGTNPKGYN